MAHDYNVKFGYDEFKKRSTGSHEDDHDYRYINYKLDMYEVKIKLTLDNRFVGVEEVKINKEFLSNKEKAAIKTYHDVADYYKD